MTNTSPAGADDPLSGVTLADTDGTPTFVGGDTNNDNVLQAGETWTYTLTVTVPPQDAGTSHTNTVTATGVDDEGNIGHRHRHGDGDLRRRGAGDRRGQDASPTTVSEGGVGNQSVTYTYAVTNTSAAAGVDPLSGVTLADTDGTPTLVSDGDSDALLEAGETWIYTLTVTVPPQDAGHQPHQHGDGHRHRRRGEHGHRHRHGDGRPTPTWRRRSAWSRPPARPRCPRGAWATRR